MKEIIYLMLIVYITFVHFELIHINAYDTLALLGTAAIFTAKYVR